MTHVGFIGLGTMGRPMADHLIAGGHTLCVDNRSPVAAHHAPARAPAGAE